MRTSVNFLAQENKQVEKVAHFRKVNNKLERQ